MKFTGEKNTLKNEQRSKKDVHIPGVVVGHEATSMEENYGFKMFIF